MGWLFAAHFIYIPEEYGAFMWGKECCATAEGIAFMKRGRSVYTVGRQQVGGVFLQGGERAKQDFFPVRIFRLRSLVSGAMRR